MRTPLLTPILGGPGRTAGDRGGYGGPAARALRRTPAEGDRETTVLGPWRPRRGRGGPPARGPRTGRCACGPPRLRREPGRDWTAACGPGLAQPLKHRLEIDLLELVGPHRQPLGGRLRPGMAVDHAGG